MLSGAAAPIPEELVSWLDGLDLHSLDWKRMLFSLLMFAVCLVLIKVLLKLLDRTFRRLNVEKSLRTFLRTVLRVLLWFAALWAVLGYNGISVTPLLGVVGVAGLAFSLALQGTLSNLAGGVMLLASKPFRADDYVEAGTVSGTVVQVGLVYTQMRTPDNKRINIPNSQITGEKIINYTAEAKRRVDLTFALAHEAEGGLVIDTIRQVVGAHPKALFTPEPFIRLTALKESCAEYTVRVWCASEDYWGLYYDLLEQIRAAFGKAGLALARPHLQVNLTESGG